MKFYLHKLFAILLFLSYQKMQAQKLAATAYVPGIIAPIDLKICGDDRLFVAERAGRIRVVNPDGTLRPTPFLDITSKISSATVSEEGFLSVAFSPDYKTSGKFYVDYTATIGGQLTSVLEQYKVSASDSNVADISSALTILTQTQPFANHNGGNLMFGKDGYLYVNFGDGGSGGDPYHNGQNKKTFLAKILRLDVSNSSSTQPYAIPPSNPFYSDTTIGIKKEIWDYGVRNPWKSSVDRLTGDLWIADVGQNAVEEIDYQAANVPGGRNYGWNIMEGKSCYSPATGCDTTGLTMPIYDYPHPLGNSIIGGYIYRSAQSKALFGTYIYGDFVAKWVYGIRQKNGILADSVSHYINTAQATGGPISFGEDKFGDQYIIFYGLNTLYKLEDTSWVRRPKAYITPIDQGSGSFLLQGLEGRNFTYQWFKDNVAIHGAISPDYTSSIPGRYTLEVTNKLSYKDTSDAYLLGWYINLLSFTAQKIPNGLVQLNWKTGSELNISGYTIQRRKNNENSFSSIDSIKSKSINDFSNIELDYTFIDSSAVNYTKLFYRLQIQHTDGSVTYSDIVFISSDETKNGFIFFPNPAKGHVEIFLNEYTQPLLMVLYSSTGKRITSQTINQQNTTIDLPASKGLYIMQISNSDGSNKVRKKLMVL